MGLLKKVGIAVAALLGLAVIGTGGLVANAALTADGLLYFPDTPAPALAASTDPEVIARGEYLVRGPAHCAQCHSAEDRARPELVKTAPLQGGLAFAMGPLGTRYGRNLTPDATTGLGRYTDAEIARTLRTGVAPDGNLSFFMWSSAATLADEDIVAVLSYLRSIEPAQHAVPPGEWYLFGKLLLTYAFPKIEPRPLASPTWVAPSEAPSEARGAYLAEHVALCTTCHTPMDPSTFAFTGPKGSGSAPEPSHGDDSDMEFVAPNLTSHPTGITGKWTEDAFVERIKQGRAHASSIMPWEGFQLTSDADLRSIYRYLKSLPPVDNDVGPTYRKVGSH